MTSTFKNDNTKEGNDSKDPVYFSNNEKESLSDLIKQIDILIEEQKQIKRYYQARKTNKKGLGTVLMWIILFLWSLFLVASFQELKQTVVPDFIVDSIKPKERLNIHSLVLLYNHQGTSESEFNIDGTDDAWQRL